MVKDFFGFSYYGPGRVSTGIKHGLLLDEIDSCLVVVPNIYLLLFSDNDALNLFLYLLVTLISTLFLSDHNPRLVCLSNCPLSFGNPFLMWTIDRTIGHSLVLFRTFPSARISTSPLVRLFSKRELQ